MSRHTTPTVNKKCEKLLNTKDNDIIKKSAKDQYKNDRQSTKNEASIAGKKLKSKNSTKNEKSVVGSVVSQKSKK